MDTETLQHQRWIKKDFVKCWQLHAIFLLPHDVTHTLLTQMHTCTRPHALECVPQWHVYYNIMLKQLCTTRTHALPHPAPSCWAPAARRFVWRQPVCSVFSCVKWVTVLADKPAALSPPPASRVSPSQQHQTVNILVINPTGLHALPSTLYELRWIQAVSWTFDFAI